MTDRVHVRNSTRPDTFESMCGLQYVHGMTDMVKDATCLECLEAIEDYGRRISSRAREIHNALIKQDRPTEGNS